MLNNPFTFDGFSTSLSTVINVIIGMCVLVVIIGISLIALFNSKDADKRHEFITAIIWIVAIVFVVGASTTIVKLVCGI